MWMNELTLIQETYNYDEIGNPVTDDIGNPIVTQTENTVFCEVKSISRSEFYNAATTGLKPSLVFIVHDFEYDDEELVKFEDKKYKVIRTYLKSIDEIELTCEKVIANG